MLAGVGILSHAGSSSKLVVQDGNTQFLKLEDIVDDAVEGAYKNGAN